MFVKFELVFKKKYLRKGLVWPLSLNERRQKKKKKTKGSCVGSSLRPRFTRRDDMRLTTNYKYYQRQSNRPVDPNFLVNNLKTIFCNFVCLFFLSFFSLFHLMITTFCCLLQFHWFFSSKNSCWMLFCN